MKLPPSDLLSLHLGYLLSPVGGSVALIWEVLIDVALHLLFTAANVVQYQRLSRQFQLGHHLATA